MGIDNDWLRNIGPAYPTPISFRSTMRSGVASPASSHAPH
jgi:hypothetical protein